MFTIFVICSIFRFWMCPPCTAVVIQAVHLRLLVLLATSQRIMCYWMSPVLPGSATHIMWPDMWHHKPQYIINKLRCYGVRGIALDWFKSYLKNRRQYMSYCGIHSRFMDIEYGVPQGSVQMCICLCGHLECVCHVFYFFLSAYACTYVYI